MHNSHSRTADACLCMPASCHLKSLGVYDLSCPTDTKLVRWLTKLLQLLPATALPRTQGEVTALCDHTERAGEDTSTYSGQEELPEAGQSVFQTRLSNMGPEAQDEMKAMRAQEEEAKHNPPVALGPSPIPLTDLAPGARLPADEQPLQFFIKRKGYNDILVSLVGVKLH